MGTFKHNKRRNTGLVYEFLVRKLSQTMINNDLGQYQKTLGIVRKYYNEDSPIFQERELFDVIRNTRGISENAARRVILEVGRVAGGLDYDKIDIKKSNIIKEINYGFGQNFWNEFRIPEYRLLATIQMMIDSYRSDKPVITESVQHIQLEEGLVQWMCSTKEFKGPAQTRDEIDQVVMAVTAKKFQEKYTTTLNRDQKVLLEKFMRSQVTGNSDGLMNYLSSEMDRITKTMNNARSSGEIKSDPMMVSKLNEAIEKFPKECANDAVEAVMLYQKLIEEIESDE